MKLAKSISKCLSLRKPQEQALIHFAAVANNLAEAKLLCKGAAIEEQVKIVQEYQKSAGLHSISSFEHNFCSMTFDMATGVGKTRLMGAFIAYLYKRFNFKNFLIVAPGTTVYEKLVADFTPGYTNKKYVFRGLDTLGWPEHKMITGDNYNSVTASAVVGADLFDDAIPITINIFNIGKLTEKQSAKENHLDKSNAAASMPRIRRVSEFLGDSYFNILSQKDDLVIIMDESHHYRANAKAGFNAINDLKPVLGIELTATPEGAKNILFSYRLPEAMRDRYVKIPAVAYRGNLNLSNFTPDELEHLKLKEADLIHSNKKIALTDYEFNHGLKQGIKPFIFVISRDIAHAKRLEEYTQSDDYCNGKYKGKVLRIDSSSSEDDIKKLLFLENPWSPYEIVIHCNKLGEGWDVTNLYTIVPLRAANELHLIMQSIGRGLRLPYGKRVGEKDIDQVIVISHDNFNKVIEQASKEMGDFEKVDLGGGSDNGQTGDSGNGMPRKKAITMTPKTESFVTREPLLASTPKDVTPENVAGKIILRMDEDANNGKKPNLNNPEYIQETKTDFATQNIREEVTEEAVEIVKQVTIDIPRITLKPVNHVTSDLASFTVDGSEIKKLRPVDNKLLIKTVLSKNATAYISKLKDDGDAFSEQDFMCQLMSEIAAIDEIDYEGNATIIKEVAEQVKDILKQCDNPKNLVINYFKRICEMVKAQLLAHRTVGNLEYENLVEPGYVKLRLISGTINENENLRDFRDDQFVKSQIKTMAFTGFKKCLYDIQKFDSDPERVLMVEMEDDETLLKWFRAEQTTFSIPYGADGSCYTPDIIMETVNEKIMCEVKAADKMTDEVVLQKAVAGRKWCELASKEDNKPWKYVLISEEEIKNRPSLDVNGLLTLGQ